MLDTHLHKAGYIVQTLLKDISPLNTCTHFIFIWIHTIVHKIQSSNTARFYTCYFLLVTSLSLTSYPGILLDLDGSIRNILAIARTVSRRTTHSAITKLPIISRNSPWTSQQTAHTICQITILINCFDWSIKPSYMLRTRAAATVHPPTVLLESFPSVYL